MKVEPAVGSGYRRRVPALKVTRAQLLAFRRRVGLLDERLPRSARTLRLAGWAGLQDSMPRAALLSLHARLDGIGPDALDDASLAQLWGPRFNTYVVPKRDFALFSVGRLFDDPKAQARSERIAALVRSRLGEARRTDREVAAELGAGIRYSGPSGTIAIRWEGARAPLVWAVPAPSVSAVDACRELARRHLRVFGPTSAASFARWAGISRRAASKTYVSLEPELLPVRTPLGEEWLLAADEAELRADSPPPAAARLLPSGDSFWLLDGAERDLLVPKPELRDRLWTPRVWPGALLVDGEIRGTWRRAKHTMQVETWTRLSRAAREAVAAEAASLPLPGVDRDVEIAWDS